MLLVIIFVMATVGFSYYIYQHRSLMKNLINREVFFGNPDRISVRLSPQGDKIAYIAPLDGVLNIHVASTADPLNGKPLTHDKGRGITSYTWTHIPNIIIYSKDNDGDENTHLYQLDTSDGSIVDITPFEGAKASIYGTSNDFIDQVIIGANNRNPEFMDLYRYNILTKTLTKVLENNHYIDFVINNQLQIVFGQTMDPLTGDTTYYDISNIESASKFMTIPQEDLYTSGIIGFNAKSTKLYYLDSRNRDKGALMEMDFAHKRSKVLAEDDKSNIASVISNPHSHEIEGYTTEYIKTTNHFFREDLKSHFETLATFDSGVVNVVSRTTDDETWIVAYTDDQGPIKYWLYNTKTSESKFLFTSNSRLDAVKSSLNPMHGIVIKSRDGLDLVSYLTVPSQAESYILKKPVPLVMFVHGGPAARDSWGYSAIHQWLSNRGYAVMSVNFRGSTGFGKKFIAAGNGQWGAKMSDDIIDAALWAVENGITTRDQIAIMGGSYGGYASLVGLTMSPDFYTCGVSIVGPSNLITLIDSIPPYWKPLRKSLITKIGGDPKTKSGRQFLESRSPLTHANQMTKPLLIGQGANDPRVKQAESDQIVKAMKENSIPGQYVLFPDEGHGFAKPTNRLAFNAITEEFFARCFNNSIYEPITDEVQKSSAIVDTWK